MSEVVEKNEALEKVITDSQIELSEAEQIKQSYLPYFAELAELKELKKKINFENPTELDEKISRELRLKTVKIRTSSEKVKEERKRIHALKANLEQSAWNLIKADCLLEEEQFAQVEKARENAEKLRIENLRNARLEILTDLVENANIYPLGQMSEDAFNDLVNGLKLQKQAKIEAEQKAEAERLENERIQKLHLERKEIAMPYYQFWTNFERELNFGNQSESDFKNFINRLQSAKSDYDAEQKRIAEENARLKKEAEAQAELRRLEQEKADKLLETQRKEAEAKAKKLKAEAEAKLAKEKAESEAKLKAEREAKENLEAELKAKQEAENKAKAEAEAKLNAEKEAAEKLAKAPLKNQLNVWVNSFQIPIFSTDNETAKLITEKFEAFKNWSKAEIEKL